MAPFAVALLVAAALVPASATTAVEEHHHRRGARLITAQQTPLRTSGRYIVDKQGERVKWACVNWYGAYSTTHAVGGLEVQPMQVIVQRIVDLGFNCVRMMYSTQGWVHNPAVLNTTLAANPHLFGMRWQEIFDLTIEAMTNASLMVIVNNHNSKSGWCCHFSQDEGLWYVPEYTEAQWIDSLVSLTARYRSNALVVAIDLRNELHDYEDTHLTWGDGNPKTDWALAATTAGNACLAANPDVIIVVMAMCFGMDLRPMKKKPIELTHPNRVVYQTHNYLEYQVFDNVSKMLKPWHEIRHWSFLFLVLVVIGLLFVYRSWTHLGRPSSPPGCGYFSVGMWLMLTTGIAVYMSWTVLSFGTMFCEIAMFTDVWPWLITSSVLCFLSLLSACYGVWKLLSRLRSQRSVVAPGGDGDAPPAGAPPQLADSGEEAGGWRGWRTVEGSGAKPSGEEGEAAAAEGRKRPLLGRLLALACGLPGALSCRHSARCFVEDGRQAGCWALGREAGPRPEAKRRRTTPAEWDRGLACGMQCGIILGVLLILLITLHVWAHILPTYWWMEFHLDGLWGFALEDGFPYTAPVWMGEFGQNVRGQYWLNFVRYLSARDVDFAYWAINGIKWSEGYVDGNSGRFVTHDPPRWENESFGILSHDYVTVRHPWMVLDLQALMDSPARWTPDQFPCRREVLGGSCGAR